jgi:hypothetical protein
MIGNIFVGQTVHVFIHATLSNSIRMNNKYILNEIYAIIINDGMQVFGDEKENTFILSLKS